MAKTVHVIAHIKVIPAKIGEAKALLLQLIEPTRTEAGCIVYQLLQSHANPAEFVFVEEWQSEAAINAHLISEHVEQTFREGMEFLVEPPSILRYELLA
jgi:quinol monooxygenase YgiN